MHHSGETLQGQTMRPHRLKLNKFLVVLFGVLGLACGTISGWVVGATLWHLLSQAYWPNQKVSGGDVPVMLCTSLGGGLGLALGAVLLGGLGRESKPTKSAFDELSMR
jgi:hypothetical protein